MKKIEFLMKKILKNLIFVFIGIAIGCLGMAYISQKASAIHVEIIKALYENSEEAAAKKAIKDKEYFKAIHHFKNLSASYSKPSIEAFQLGKENWGIMFPFHAIILRRIQETSDPKGIGASRINGIYHGWLAYALEKYGMNDEAEKEWKESTLLLEKNNLVDTKELIEKTINM